MAKKPGKADEPSADLCIIFAEDTKPWAEYFKDNFKNNANTSCFLCDVTHVTPHPTIQTQTTLESSKAIMILISNQMRGYLVMNKGVNFNTCVTDISKGILFFFSVTEGEMDEHDLQCRFQMYSDDRWTKLLHDDNSTSEDLQQNMAKVLQLIDKNTIVEPPSNLDTTDDPIGECAQEEPDADDSAYLIMDHSRKPTKQTQDINLEMQDQLKQGDLTQPAAESENDIYDIHLVHQREAVDSYDIQLIGSRDQAESYETTDFTSKPCRPKKKEAAKQISVEAIPSVLSCEETTEVCLCFKEEVKDFVQGKMELEIYNLEDRSEKFEIKDVERINPYTFKFTSHGFNSEKSLRIDVYFNNEKIGKTDIKYHSYTTVVDGVNQVLLQVMDVICTTVKVNNTELLTKADAMLKKVFMSQETAIPPSAFENLFGIYNYSLDERSKESTPTILHLAAKYGLKELSSKLIDLPHAKLANCISNKDNRLPSEIAKDSGYDELGIVLEQFSEMGNDEIYDLYVRMQWYDAGYLQPQNQRMREYYNQSIKNPAGALYYTSSNNTTSRFPTQDVYSDADPKPSEGYMTMDGVKRTLLLPPEKPQPKPPKMGPAILDQDIYTDADLEKDENDDVLTQSLSLNHGNKMVPEDFIAKRRSQSLKDVKDPERSHRAKLQHSKSIDTDMENIEGKQTETLSHFNTVEDGAVCSKHNFEGSTDKLHPVERSSNPFEQQSIKYRITPFGGTVSPVLSPELEELADINRHVADGNYSIDEARQLYFEWQRKQPKDDSFKGKQERMKRLQEVKKGALQQQEQQQKESQVQPEKSPLINPKPKPKTGNVITRLFRKNYEDTVIKDKKIADIHLGKETKTYIKTSEVTRYVTPSQPKEPLENQQVYDDVEDTQQPVSITKDRDSLQSNGSSRDSKDSGNGSAQENESSRTDMFKDNLQHGTPIIPPKLPPKGLHLMMPPASFSASEDSTCGISPGRPRLLSPALDEGSYPLDSDISAAAEPSTAGGDRIAVAGGRPMPKIRPQTSIKPTVPARPK